MTNTTQSIVVIDFMREDIPREFNLHEGGIDFHIMWHSIGWNHQTAAQLLQRLDGHVDAFAFCGVREKIGYGNDEFILQSTQDVVAGVEYTPVYFGQELQRIFGNWALNRVCEDYPNLFKGKKVLLHSATFTPFAQTFVDLGAKIQAADALSILRIPLLLTGEKQIHTFLRGLPLLASNDLSTARHPTNLYRGRGQASRRKRLSEWVAKADVFVTYSRLIEDWVDLSALRGKILVTDWLEPDLRMRLQKAGVLETIEGAPPLKSMEIMGRSSFSLLTAILDRVRLSEGGKSNLKDYALEYIERNQVELRRPVFDKRPTRRCAFVVHPLTSSQLADVPQFRWWMRHLPDPMRESTERVLTHLPVQRVGSIRGARSTKTGQEVVCDLWAVVATAKRMRMMDEEFLYGKLLTIAEHAHKDGAVMMGLGAFTKVVGDSGLTVSRRSPIPVTTGNSLSASATIWAAREAMRRLGLVKIPEDGSPICGKAMVIGATGSIGRVTAHLLSRKFTTLVVVAPRPEALLKLRDEIAKISPSTQVIMSTSSDADLMDCELIVTATSMPGGGVLDIEKVKPGAVISDVSRPLNITAEEAKRRLDVLAIESGEISLPGEVTCNVNLGLTDDTVYACIAETILLTMEGRYECFSISRNLSMDKVIEIEEICRKHGADLATIQTPLGELTEARLDECRRLAQERLQNWPPKAATATAKPSRKN